MFDADEKGVASRDAGGKVLNAIVKNVPWLIGLVVTGQVVGTALAGRLRSAGLSGR